MKRQKLTASLLYGAYLLTAIELLLGLAALMSSDLNLVLSNRYGAPIYVADEALGIRPNPRARDHDRRGFRNASALDRADLVALGDSQTYGINARRDEAWPQKLSQILGDSVYNMACGTWAPPHYLHLLEQALSLEPEWILTALYSGNDLMDSAIFTFRSPVGSSAVQPHLSPDVASLMEQRILEVETESVLAARLLEPDFSQSPSAVIQRNSWQITFWGTLATAVREHSKLYGALRALSAGIRDLAARSHRDVSETLVNEVHWKELQEEAANDTGLTLFERGLVRTVLHPGYRLRGVGLLEDPVLQEGLRIALTAVSLIENRTKAAAVRHLVVLIPSKEYVYYPFVEELRRSQELERLAASEAEVWRRVTEQLASRQIALVDTLPALREAVASGRQIYPYSTQSHPSAIGYGVIASAVAKKLQALLGETGPASLTAADPNAQPSTKRD